MIRAAFVLSTTTAAFALATGYALTLVYGPVEAAALACMAGMAWAMWASCGRGAACGGCCAMPEPTSMEDPDVETREALHECGEDCLFACPDCGHEVDHGWTFHAPTCGFVATIRVATAPAPAGPEEPRYDPPREPDGSEVPTPGVNEPPDEALVLHLSPMERDMLVAICDEGIEDWNDQTAVGLRAKVLALSISPTAGGGDG